MPQQTMRVLSHVHDYLELICHDVEVIKNNQEIIKEDLEMKKVQSRENEKCENDRAKAEDARLKTRKRVCESKEEKAKRQRSSGSDAMEFLADRARINYEMKQQEFTMLKVQQALEREKMETMVKQQLQTQLFKVLQQQQQQSQQQLVTTQMMMVQQQQEQSRAKMALLRKFTNKRSMDLCQKAGFAAYSAALHVIPIK
ncbi:mRNA export factor GLE1-like [Montipora foliosa]|uniref:mRNA export factor GLE1-like n=1 Tax=Montipora foliosa TaxID=591990 RepID=UPI0035F12906